MGDVEVRCNGGNLYSPEWDCGNGNHAVEDIVLDCSRRKLQGEMKNIMELIRKALEWIDILDISL